MKREWAEWWLLPLKVFVVLAVGVVPFADSSAMPSVPALDMSLDMLVGWVCLFCSLVFTAASVIQRFFGPEGAARRSVAFAVVAFILGAILSPLFAVA
jgi:hypothetical protein